MSRLSLCLFGPPTLAIDGRPVMLDRWKAVALLAYLALEDGLHRRDGLAALFWPELNQAQARNGLRRTLNAIKHALGDQWLAVSRETIGIRRTPDLTVDVWRFRALTKAPAGAVPVPAALQEAIALYRADFLAEFSLRDAPAFEDWRYFAAEQLRQELAGAIVALLAAQTASGDLPAALQTARRWLALDPLDEHAHRTLIELHLAAGDRAAAVRQYEHCVQLLAQELGVEPDAATRGLLENPCEHPQPGLRVQPLVPPPRAAGAGAISQVMDAVRQIVVLNAAILAWPAAGAPFEQPALDVFLAGAATGLQRYAAHVEHLGRDGIVACFGVPISHEDDAERGLHLVFDLREAAQRAGIEVAAGIKIGPALVSWREQPGAVQAQEVFGALLGQAAELQRAAAPGQILVDRATYLHTRSSCTYREVEVSLRGQAAATAVYCAEAVLPLRKTRGIPGLQSALVGRTAELAILEQAVAGLARGAGQVLLLSGEAGIGKSRLVAETRARHAQHALWLEGRCLEMTEAVSYGPFLGALRDYFGGPYDAGEEAQAAAIREGLARLAHPAGGSAWDEATCGEIGAVLGRLLGVRYGSTGSAGQRWDDILTNAAPAELRQRTLAALRTLLGAIAHTPPLVLVLEDLHWADDASLDLLNELLPTVCAQPLLLLCIYRPVPERRCAQLPVIAARKCPAHHQELRLRELTPGETAEMVRSLLEIEALAPPTKDWIQECSQGNPYFTEETILALIEAGLIRREDGVWRTSDPRGGAPVDLTLSFSVDQLIVTRVDRLPAPLRHTLEAAAVLGRTFALPLLHAVLADAGPPAGQIGAAQTGEPGAQTGAQTGAQVEELLRSSFFYCERVAPVAEYSFRHVLLQAAIYQMLPGARRSTLHLQAAQAIERMYADSLDAHVDALAYHYARTQDLQRAVEYLLQAGAAARRVFANAAALAYFEQAIDRLAQLDRQGRPVFHLVWSEAWHQLGRTCYAAGDFDRAEAALREAIAHAQAAGAPAPAIVRLVYWLGEALYWESKVDEFAANARAGLALLPPDAPCCETALMLGHLAAACMSLDDPGQYDRWVMQLRPLVRTLPFCEELSPAYHQVINQYKLIGNATAALEWVEALHAAAVAQKDMTSLAKAVMIRGVMLSEQGDYGGAAPVLQEALGLSRRIGESTLLFFCLRRLALNAVVQGDAQAACRYTGQLLELVEIDPALAAEGRITCGVLYLSAGKIEEALGLLTPAAPGDPANELYDAAEVRYWRGCALAAAGCTADAAVQYEAVLRGCPPDHGPLPVYPEMKPIYWAAIAALARLLPDPHVFRTLCDAERAKWPAHGETDRCRWYGVAAEVLGGAGPDAHARIRDRNGSGCEITDELLAQWQWCDPYKDSTCRIAGGVELAAAAGRDLWYINTGAPSLRTDVAGDFVLEARCLPPTLELPAVPAPVLGGLLLWCDAANFLRLDWGGLGPGEISCLGATGGDRRFWGRDFTACAQPYLRLERRGQVVRALYSEDGAQWLLVGETVLVGEGPWAAGLFGLGMVDRLVYPGTAAGGGAIRFASIRLWQAQSCAASSL